MSRRTYYRVCEYCGSTLDPEERCTCQTDREKDMDDNTLMIMATIENVNRTLNEIKDILVQLELDSIKSIVEDTRVKLESISEELHEVDYRTLKLTNYEEDDNEEAI